MASLSNTPGMQAPPAWLRDDLIESHVPSVHSSAGSSHGLISNNPGNIGLSSSSDGSTSRNFLTGMTSGVGGEVPMDRKKLFLFWGLKIVSLGLCILMAGIIMLKHYDMT